MVFLREAFTIALVAPRSFSVGSYTFDSGTKGLNFFKKSRRLVQPRCSRKYSASSSVSGSVHWIKSSRFTFSEANTSMKE